MLKCPTVPIRLDRPLSIPNSCTVEVWEWMGNFISLFRIRDSLTICLCAFSIILLQFYVPFYVKRECLLEFECANRLKVHSLYLYNGCNYLSMLRFNSIHLSKRGPFWDNIYIYVIFISRYVKQCSKIAASPLPEADNFGGGNIFVKIFCNFLFMIWNPSRARPEALSDRQGQVKMPKNWSLDRSHFYLNFPRG